MRENIRRKLRFVRRVMQKRMKRIHSRVNIITEITESTTTNTVSDTEEDCTRSDAEREHRKSNSLFPERFSNVDVKSFIKTEVTE